MVVIRTVTEAATSVLSKLLAPSVIVSNARTFSSGEPSYSSNKYTTLFDSHLIQRYTHDNSGKGYCNSVIGYAGMMNLGLVHLAH